MKICYLFILSCAIYSQCADYLESQCDSVENCDWVEIIEYGDCGDFTSSSECWQNGCSWYSGTYYPVFQGCSGTYQIDNGYCAESDSIECSDVGQSQCNSIESCQWITDISNINCDNLSDNECGNYAECSLLQGECIQWGSWYTFICYEYDYQCAGGVVQLDNSYCEEVQYQLGDINNDSFINISDIILLVNFIVQINTPSSIEFLASDYNEDFILNVLDIIQIVNVILNS